MDAQLLAFAGISLLLTVTPGADTALVMRSVLSGGRGAGLAAGLGVGSGLWFHAFCSAVGLSALLAHSAQAYNVVKWLGAAYLMYLGVKSLLDKGHAPVPDDQPAPSAQTLTPLAAYGQGLLTNILNPKVALFYLTFLPQFMRPGDSVLPRSLLLAGIHFTWGLLWAALIVAMMGRFRALLAQPKVKQRLSRITGAVLLAFGLKVAFD